MKDDFENNTYSGYLNDSNSRPRYLPIDGFECIAFEFTSALLICISSTTLFFSIVTVRIMRTVANAYVANLAVADFCVGIQVIVKLLFNFVVSGVQSRRNACLLKTFFQLVSVKASLFTLVTVGIERYIFCFHPHAHTIVFRRWVNAIIVLCIWICAMTATTFALHGHRWSDESSCNAGNIISRNGLFALAVIFILAVILVAVIYANIALRLWRVLSRVNPCSGNSTGSIVRQNQIDMGVKELNGRTGNRTQRTILKHSSLSSSSHPMPGCSWHLETHFVSSDARRHNVGTTRDDSKSADNVISRSGLREGFEPQAVSPLSNSAFRHQQLTPVQNQASSENSLHRKKVTFIFEQRLERTSPLNKKEIRLVKTLFLVVVYLFVAWIPMICVMSAKPPGDMAKWIFCVVHTLLYSSSFLNTVFFFCLCRNFRLAIRAFIRCKFDNFCCRPVNQEA